MSFEVGWSIPNYVVYHRISEHFTVAEFFECIAALNRLIDSSPQPIVHSINNITAVTSSDVGLKEVRQSISLIHPKLGINLLVKPVNPAVSYLVNFLITVMSQFVALKFRLVESEADALAYLQEHHLINPNATA